MHKDIIKFKNYQQLRFIEGDYLLIVSCARKYKGTDRVRFISRNNKEYKFIFISDKNPENNINLLNGIHSCFSVLKASNKYSDIISMMKQYDRSTCLRIQYIVML